MKALSQRKQEGTGPNMFIIHRMRERTGIVLITVLMMSVVMMILAIGIIGTNITAVTSGQRQIDRIKSEQLAKGTFWISYSKLSATPPDNTTTFVNPSLDGKTFTSIVSNGATTATGIGGSTKSSSVAVSY